MMKWSAEALVAAAATILTVGGSVTVTAVHWGTATAQIAQVQQAQGNLAQKLDQHQQELSDQKTHNATVEQKLDDVISRLDRMEKKL